MEESMMTHDQEANSKARVRILSDVKTWAGFDAHFEGDWQRKEMMEKLAKADIDLGLVGEWAMWSFHELAKEEAKWKRERGENFKRSLRMTLKSCDQTTNLYKTYSSLPEDDPEIASVNQAFAEFVKGNETVAERSRQLLEKAENSSIFESKRLGLNWNCLYLVLLKYYIALETGWNETKVLAAVTDLVAAAHETLGRRTPPTLRVLLRKAIHHFESNAENATILDRAKKIVSNPVHLYRNFPFYA
jgi:hypothetical protein